MSNIKKLSDEQKVVSAAAVLHTFDRFREELLDNEATAGEKRMEEMRFALVGILELTSPAGGKACADHIVGHMETGFNNRNLSGTQFLREVQRDPAMTAQYFHRYRFCPVCGQKIQWDDEED